MAMRPPAHRRSRRVDKTKPVGAIDFEEVTVVEVAPAHLRRGANIVAQEAFSKAFRDARIEEHAHSRDR